MDFKKDIHLIDTIEFIFEEPTIKEKWKKVVLITKDFKRVFVSTGLLQPQMLMSMYFDGPAQVCRQERSKHRSFVDIDWCLHFMAENGKNPITQKQISIWSELKNNVIKQAQEN